jgi:hypothetical protein
MSPTRVPETPVFLGLNKDENMKDGVGIKMMQLDSLVEEQIIEKIRNREG